MTHHDLCCAVLRHTVMSNSLWPHGLQPARLLCPWGFSRKEYWQSGLPFPSPWDLPNPGIEPRSPALQADSLLSEPPGKSNHDLLVGLAIINNQVKITIILIPIFTLIQGIRIHHILSSSAYVLYLHLALWLNFHVESKIYTPIKYFDFG